MRQPRHARALELCEDAIRINEKIYNHDHPTIATELSYLGIFTKRKPEPVDLAEVVTENTSPDEAPNEDDTQTQKVGISCRLV